MIRMLFTLPTSIDLAFSGGVDSLAIAHFLSQSKKNIRLWHFNHGCDHSDGIETQCRAWADKLQLEMVVGRLQSPRPPKMSPEEFWRTERYAFLRSSNRYMMTAHHLNDAVETWVWSSLHGEGKVIPPQNGTIVRPFLLTEKKSFEEYAHRHHLTPVHDPYNTDTSLMRNYMRKNLMEHVQYINPGISKVIRKKYLTLGPIELTPLPTARKSNP